MRLPGVDATNCFAVGNFDDDPANEIAVATKVLADYNGESAVNSQYWVLSVLKLNQSNTLEKVWETNFHKVNELKNNYTGVSADDFDGDGLDEIFFTPYPHGYYIAFQDDHYEVKSYLQGINSNAVLNVSDDQVCLQGDSTIMVLEREDPGARPLAPSDFQVSYVDTSEVQLNWNPIAGAGSYLISRWDFDLSIEQEIGTIASTYNDSTVIPGHLYRYKILAVDSSFSIPRSQFSAPIKIRAEMLPVFEGLTVEGEDQLLLSFSKPLGSAATEVRKFTLYPGQKNPSGIISARAGTQLLLSFSKPFTATEHQLVFYDLENEYNVPFYKDSLTVTFSPNQKSSHPFVKKVEMISKSHLLIYFNNPMDQSSAGDINNYLVYPDDQVIEAGLDPIDPKTVHIYLTGKNRMGSLGEVYYLEVRGLKDIWNQSIDSDLGNKFEILQQVYNLDNIVVYPNPFRMDVSGNEIMFANLPNGCEIFVYTANGRKLVHLTHDSFTGGVGWDLKNEQGDKIASGVYIYVAQYRGQEKTGKFLIIR